MLRKKKNKFKSAVLYILIVGLLSVSGYAYRSFSRHLQSITSEFELQDIKISGNTLVSRSRILQMIGLDPGVKLLAIQVDQVAEKLLESPFVESASAAYSLPSTLRIEIVERKPMAFVYGNGLNMIDEMGFIMPIPPISKSWDLPVITGFKENIGVQGAVTSSARLKKVLNLLSDISEMKAPFPQLVSEMNCSDNHFLQIRLCDSPTSLRVSYDDCFLQLFVAAGYLHDYTDFEQLKKIDYIDLRFDGQIVVGEKKG